jgi:hypothetical protein
MKVESKREQRESRISQREQEKNSTALAIKNHVANQENNQSLSSVLQLSAIRMLQKLDEDDRAIEQAAKIIQMESKVSAFDAKLDAMIAYFKSKEI